MNKIHLTGIVLSGGKSVRMGSEKGLMLFNNIPLIEYSISVLKQLCEDIVICTNNPDYSYLKLPMIPDIFIDCGPMGGIYSGLLASKTKFSLVIPCDMPNISKKIFTELLLHSNDTNAVIPSINNKIQPLCGIYSTNCIPILKNLLEHNKVKMKKAIVELGAKIIPLQIPEISITNINTKEDLNFYAERI